MDLGVFKYVIALAMAGVSVLMMSRVVYPSFKHINMRTRGTMYAIVLIVLTVICIFKFPWVMPAVIFSIYLLYGLVRPWVARRPGWLARICRVSNLGHAFGPGLFLGKENVRLRNSPQFSRTAV